MGPFLILKIKKKPKTKTKQKWRITTVDCFLNIEWINDDEGIFLFERKKKNNNNFENSYRVSTVDNARYCTLYVFLWSVKYFNSKMYFGVHKEREKCYNAVCEWQDRRCIHWKIHPVPQYRPTSKAIISIAFYRPRRLHP